MKYMSVKMFSASIKNVGFVGRTATGDKNQIQLLTHFSSKKIHVSRVVDKSLSSIDTKVF